MPFSLPEEKRWEVVRLHKNTPLSMRALARRFHVHHRTIERLIHCYKETGSVHDRPTSGRPSAMNEDMLSDLDRIIHKHNTAPSTHLAYLLQNKTGRRISPRSIRRVRRTTLARHPVREIIVKTLTQGEKHKRLSFAQAHATDDFHQVAFTDEAFFGLDNTGRVHWIKKGETQPTREVKDLKIKFMVWGAVGWWGKSELCICEENVTAHYYTQILGEYLAPFMPNFTRYRLMHDNAAPHKAALTKNWLAEFGIKTLDDYPPYSPELNPIEHVWSWMHAFVCAQAPTNRASLEKAVRLAWQEIPIDVIRGYITHLRTVCQQIIQAEGDHI